MERNTLKHLIVSLGCAAALLVAPHAMASTSHIALMNLKATGLQPNAVVTLSTGEKQTMTAQTDPSGTAQFQNLKYSATNNLFFALDFSVKAAGEKSLNNSLVFDLNPFTGALKLRGNASRAASIVVNLSSEDSKTMVANQNGYFQGVAYSRSGLDKGQLRILTSIVNVNETCCPRAFQPYKPVTITISATPQQQKAEFDIIENQIETVVETRLPSANYAVSVPDSTMNRSWVDGVRKFGNQVTKTLQQQTTSIGTFFDAQNNINTQRVLQERSAQAAKTYTPSEALCRYGSMSLSLAESDARAEANKVMLMRALDAHDSARKGTAYAGDSGSLLQSRMSRLQTSSCDPTSGNTAVRRLCKDNDDDKHYNADVDYTRALDIPMTLDVDFTGKASATDSKSQDAVMALADSLFPAQPLRQAASTNGYLTSSSMHRSLQAIRAVAKNSFATIVAEKTKGTQGSEAYITNLIKAMGVPVAQARLLMGENPSYFAQMEVLTKKLYQSPTFYVNLMDTPANVERQRAAIRAIKLQQGRDFVETIKRREMLLAVLLELKLREKEKTAHAQITRSN